MNWDQNLRLRHVRCFLETARAESVSLAAARLNITQPAVSRSLKELEEMLGTSLFERVGRGLRLNEAGRVFQSHAAASMTQLMQGCDRVMRTGQLNLRLSVGALPTASTELLPRALIAFQQRAPHVGTHVLTGPNWLLFDHLRDGALDLVVGRMPEREKARGVTFEQLYIEQVVLICRPNHPILAASNPSDDIASYALIMPPKGAVIATAVDRFLSSIALADTQGVIETVSLPIGRKLVQASDALWFISRGVVSHELSDGSLAEVDLASPLLSGSVGISVSRSAPLSVERSLLAECLRDAVSRDAPKA